MSDTLTLESKLFHPILVLFCALLTAPLFTYFSFLLLGDLISGKTDSVAGPLFIFVTTIALTIWGINALKSVIFRPRITISPEGVFFDISRKSRSWGTIPWSSIIGLAANYNKRSGNCVFIYLSPLSPLFNKARKDRFLGGQFLMVNCRYMDNASHIVKLLAEKNALEPANVPLLYFFGKTQNEEIV
jgi:hypothetical protein